MKKLVAILGVLLFISTTKASATFLKDTLPVLDSADALMYENKGRDQAGAGTILLAGGAIMGTVGFGLAMSGLSHLFDPNYQPKDYGSLPEILGYGGLALAIVGIILLRVSKKNKLKAKIILGNRRLSLPGPSFRTKGYTTTGLVINF